MIGRCFLSKPKCRELFQHLESNVTTESLPVVRMIVPIHDAHGAFATVKWNHGSLTEKAIIQYWRDSSSGRVEYETKSESTGGVVHLENSGGADLRQIVTITASNLRQTLKDRKARDLVLVLWQDDCPLSQKYLDMQKRLATFLAGKTGAFLFAAYNLSKNGKMGLKVGKVPALRLYKLHYGIHFDEYDSDQGVDFDRMLSFLLDYSS